MKKFFFILLIFSITTAYTQEVKKLDIAIQEFIDYLNIRLQAQTVIAVISIKSEYQILSEYVIDELINSIVNSENLSAVERKDLDIIQDELRFQLSGDVSDESAQAIGKMVGAQTIITGNFTTINENYRLVIRAISVETAEIQGIIPIDITNDKQIKILTGNVYNFPISIGGGIYTGASFTEGKKETNGKDNLPTDPYLYDYTITETNSRSEFDIGAFIFFDLKYAAINISWINDFGKMAQSWNKEYFYNNKVIHEEKKPNSSGTYSSSLLNIGILAKYPFTITKKITLFPALGADYQLWLYSAENGKKVPGDLSANNSILLKTGGGIDYAIAKSLFLRGELFWGVKLPSKNENRDSFKWFTHSPALNVGIGYLF